MDYSLRSIVDAFDEAHYVQIDEDNEIVYVWNGSLTVNMYTLYDLHNFDCFTMGEDPESIWDVKASIQNHISYLEDEEDES